MARTMRASRGNHCTSSFAMIIAHIAKTGLGFQESDADISYDSIGINQGPNTFRVNKFQRHKITMKIFQKLVGRRNDTVMAVDDNCVGESFERRHQDQKIKGDPFSYRRPNIDTSNIDNHSTFDCDEKFMIVAKLLLCRHETEKLSPKDAINATLTTSKEKKDFLEALDTRHTTNIQSQGLAGNSNSHSSTSTIDHQIVLKTRAIFVGDLKELWRQSILSTGFRPSNGQSKTPTKHIHSPIKSSHKIAAERPRSNKHRVQQRFFFSDFDQQFRRGSSSSSVQLDFTLSACGAKPVQSLQLDGIPQTATFDAYAPPSPIVAH